MNDRSVIQTPPSSGSGPLWLDSYLQDGYTIQPAAKPKLLDIAAIRGILYRQRWLVCLIVIASLIGGVVWTMMATPMYEAQTTVRVDPTGNNVVEGQDVLPEIYGNRISTYLSTQVEIIKSRNLAAVVAADRNLGERYDFLGTNIDESRPPGRTDEQWQADKQQLATRMLALQVDAEPPIDSQIITISYRSEDPVIAAEMANAYADAFAASDTRNRVDSNQYAQEYLQEQIALVRERLQNAEQAANSYARDSSIIIQTPGLQDDSQGAITITNARLSNINERVSNARADRIAAEQRWQAIRNLPAAQLPEVQNNPVLQGLVTDRTAKQAELSSLQQRYTDDFPKVIDIKAEIATLDTQINKASADIKATVRNNYLVALSQEKALQSELNSVKSDTLMEQDSQVQFSVLEREAEALRDQLRALLDRFNTISTAANVQAGNITKLDPALVPGGPYEPNLMRNLAFALVFGIAFAGGLAVLRETLDDRIRSLDDVEEKIGLTLLGHTPFVEPKDLERSEDRFGSLMEAYASIRSAIDFTLPRDQNVIQLTSSQASEGKSTTAVILAELFANLGRKTLLIDADLRRPSIAELVNIDKPEVGLVEVVLGHTDLQSAIVKGLHENLDILPVASVSPNPTEIFASPQMREFVEECRREYSLVIFDSCPVMGIADAPMLASLADGTVFVLEANKVPFGQARAAIRRIRMGNGNVIGAVLTKYRALEAGQSYDYQYGYYHYGK